VSVAHPPQTSAVSKQKYNCLPCALASERETLAAKSGFADGKYASHAKAPGLVRIKIKIDTL